MEVASCVSENWMQRFPEKDLRAVVLEKLGASEVSEVKLDKEAKTITVEYKGGDSGAGAHDGCLYICEEDMRLYDYREEGKYFVWLEDLPENIKDLGRCLGSSNWDEAWDE